MVEDLYSPIVTSGVLLQTLEYVFDRLKRVDPRARPMLPDEHAEEAYIRTHVEDTTLLPYLNSVPQVLFPLKDLLIEKLRLILILLSHCHSVGQHVGAWRRVEPIFRDHICHQLLQPGLIFPDHHHALPHSRM